ncbi:MAG: hypothetical protein RLZZ277_604 [Actinomycetota bacterium]|jgi:hypothetical protein
MFQPKPINLIPKLVQAKVPVWLVAAIVAVDIVVVQVGQSHEPNCELTYQSPHYSTSVQESLRQDAIKFNLTSNCTENQTHTELKITISSVDEGLEKVLLKSNLVQQDASKKDRTKAHFLEFWVLCKRGGTEKYLSNAHGSVLLQSGKRISVSNSIDKPLAILCEPKAK